MAVFPGKGFPDHYVHREFRRIDDAPETLKKPGISHVRRSRRNFAAAFIAKHHRNDVRPGFRRRIKKIGVEFQEARPMRRRPFGKHQKRSSRFNGRLHVGPDSQKRPLVAAFDEDRAHGLSDGTENRPLGNFRLCHKPRRQHGIERKDVQE